jgi:hypothetical protein
MNAPISKYFTRYDAFGANITSLFKREINEFIREFNFDFTKYSHDVLASNSNNNDVEHPKS